jgi:translation initiation factor 1 (eIF-1/SUI1)
LALSWKTTQTTEGKTMTLTEIIKAAAQRMQNATVDMDSRYGTVCISTDGQDDIFMQGDEAGGFIDQVQDLYEKAGDVTEDEAALCHAEQYAECIWG